ncbi:unnamed protein product [Medioppia subpectinata]|uniref:Uncharacterized protein n=1 Tax=Medioppia subpectinata TaxID=1979941 RepID=A0A7R9KEY9_9ACAR|nr:unnamed protein product [Medioppia subpectinata]CAG2102110.1 unnamed protein product [Medioppia subpectinata]
MFNRLCEPDFTIDSAFVDKYSDLGSDVITLFSNTTVHQLTIDSNETIQYKRSIPLNEWSKGTVMCGRDSHVWSIWSHNKTINKHRILPKQHSRIIVLEQLVILPIVLKRSILFLQKDILIEDDYYIKGVNFYYNHTMYLIPILRRNNNNNLPIDEIEGYLNETTADFAFNDYFYLFAGNRVCRVNNKTLQFADNCLTQTIAQWMGCKDMPLNLNKNNISKTQVIVRRRHKTSHRKTYTLITKSTEKLSKTQSTSTSVDENRPTDLKSISTYKAIDG